MAKQTLNFFFSAEQKDIIITLGDKPELTVGDLAVCIEGDPANGLFGDDQDKAIKSADEFISTDWAEHGSILFLIKGGVLNNVPAGYTLIKTIAA